MRAEVGIFGAFEDGPQDVVITVSGEEPHSVEFGGLVDVGGHVLGQAAGSRVFEGGRVQVLQPQLLCLLQEDGSQCGDGLCLGDRCVGFPSDAPWRLSEAATRSVGPGRSDCCG